MKYLPSLPFKPSPRLRAAQRICRNVFAALTLSLLAAQARGNTASTFTPAFSMSLARYGQTTTLLNDGRVLVAGGEDDVNYGKVDAEIYDPATGTWTVTGNMTEARGEASAVLLRDGRVLVVGGYNNDFFLATAEIYDPITGVWTPTGSMAFARSFQTCTRLQDGTVLITGGRGDTLGNADSYVSAETFDPSTNSFTATAGGMTVARSYHSAALLQDGTVLITGGVNSVDAAIGTAEIYDPSTRTFTATGDMVQARNEQTSTLLPDGRVLVAGGYNIDGDSLPSTETYSPGTGTFASAASMIQAHTEAASILLPNGKVIIIAGQGRFDDGDGGFFNNSIATAEIYDPATDSWTNTDGDLPDAVQQFGAVLLPSGRILIAGGYGDDLGGTVNTAEIYETAQGFFTLTSPLDTIRGFQNASLLPDGRVLVSGGDNGTIVYDTAQIYQPADGSWSFTGNSNVARELTPATLLANGKVLVAGGSGAEQLLSSAELYNPANGTWTLTGSLAANRYYHTATLLHDGEVLVVGGFNDNGPIATAEIYNPFSGTWHTVNPMSRARYLHTATLLPNGQVLVAGGTDNVTDANTAELFDPNTETWTVTGTMTQGRFEHTATLLPSGDVLVAGGMFNGAVLDSAEIYDPSTGTWAATGSLAAPRRFQSANLLPNGQVLVVGGKTTGSTFLDTGETYDPANGTWSAAGTLATARELQTATLLPNGQILLAGGITTGNVATGSVELYDRGLAFQLNNQPFIEDATNPLMLSQQLALSGGQLEGNSEASGGNGALSSPTNHPVVQIRHIDSDQVKFLSVDPAIGFDSGSFTSTALNDFTPGPALVTVFTNGIPSWSFYIVVTLATPAITLQVPATASVNTPIAASATLSGGSNPTGTIVFFLFGPNVPNCDDEAVAVFPVTADGDGTYNSGSYTPTTAGIYHWEVFYTGDENNSFIGTACGAPNTTTTVLVGPTPTPTPTPTPSASPSATPTSTPTPTPSVSPSPSPSATPVPAEAQNLSSRVAVSTGDGQAIGGFIITGSATKRVLLRGLGSSLVRQGITGFLANPRIDLYDAAGTLLQSNDNWQDSQEAAIQATGLAPTDSQEAALIAMLSPGNYTFVLSGVDSQSGVGLTEIYDLKQSALSRIGNLSTRGDVERGENVVIAGFILGAQEADADIVIRGLGPSLTEQNVHNVLADPSINLFDGNGNLLMSDNDWQDDPAQAALLQDSGLAPQKAKEAALEVSLPAGAYTAVLSGNGGTGIGLVEIYNK